MTNKKIYGLTLLRIILQRVNKRSPRRKKKKKRKRLKEIISLRIRNEYLINENTKQIILIKTESQLIMNLTIYE